MIRLYARRDAAGGIAVTVLEEIRKDQIPAVETDPELVHGPSRYAEGSERVVLFLGHAGLVLLHVGVQGLAREDDVAHESRAIGIESRYEHGVDTPQPSEVRGKATGFAPIEALEIAVEETVGIEIDDQRSGDRILGGHAERAGRLNRQTHRTSFWKMLNIELPDRVGCVH